MPQSQGNSLVSQALVEKGILKRVYADGTTVYRAEGHYDNRLKKRLASKTFKGKGALSAAKSYRSNQLQALQNGTAGAVQKATVEQAVWCFLEAAYTGRIQTRGGERYKLSTLGTYRSMLANHVLPKFGRRQLTDVASPEVREWLQTLTDTLGPTAVNGAIIVLRVLYRLAIEMGYAKIDPTDGVRRMRETSRRERVATTAEAQRLIDALQHPRDRALFATAFFTGLRRGELQALTWQHVDFEARLIRVRRNHDDRNKVFTTPKTDAGLRDALLPAPLVPYLMAIRRSEGLVFGRDDAPEVPFHADAARVRAKLLWDAAGLTPIRLHECRHTAATWMIYAGLNIKEVSKRMGHSKVQITLDRYGHLLPGGELEALGLLDEYLNRKAA